VVDDREGLRRRSEPKETSVSYDDEREAKANAELDAQTSEPGPVRSVCLPANCVKRLRLTMVHPSGTRHPVAALFFNPDGSVWRILTERTRSLGPFYDIPENEIGLVRLQLEELDAA
jgi:hypothetical protein